MKFAITLLLVIATTTLDAPPSVAQDNAALWRALKTPGHFAMIRHAIAPGTGDPSEFAIDDCATQRNLSDEGREQAKRIGDKFRDAGIASAEIHTSQWCRCRETAVLLKLGPVVDMPSLNSFYEMPENKGAQMKALRKWLTENPMDKPLLLVTHFVNIGALSGTYPSSGGVVVIRRDADGSLKTKGTIDTR